MLLSNYYKGFGTKMQSKRFTDQLESVRILLKIALRDNESFLSIGTFTGANIF